MPATGSRPPNAVVSPDYAGAWSDRRQCVRVDVEMCGRCCRPRHGVEIEQQRARRRRGIGDVDAAQPVQQPGVGGRAHAVARHSLAQPAHLGRSEIGVERQAGERLQRLLMRPQCVAHGERAAVLPGDGDRQRAARGAVPRQHGLALVGEAQGGDRRAGACDRLPAGFEHRLPELLGILLDAAVGSDVRMHRHLGFAQHGARGRHHQRLGGRGSLVDGEHVHGGAV